MATAKGKSQVIVAGGGIGGLSAVLCHSVCLAHNFEKHAGDWTKALAAYQDERIVRAYRVVLSSRQLGQVYHAEGVERRIRNSVLGAKSARDFYDGLQWLYGGTGLSGERDNANAA